MHSENKLHSHGTSFSDANVSLVAIGSEDPRIDLALTQDNSDAASIADLTDPSKPSDMTTFKTVSKMAAPSIKVEEKRAGCYVTTLNGSQDKITKTVCPAPAPTCVPCVGCGVPQC